LLLCGDETAIEVLKVQPLGCPVHVLPVLGGLSGPAY
jgi:hypothetical protein